MTLPKRARPFAAAAGLFRSVRCVASASVCLSLVLGSLGAVAQVALDIAPERPLIVGRYVADAAMPLAQSVEAIRSAATMYDPVLQPLALVWVDVPTASESRPSTYYGALFEQLGDSVPRLAVTVPDSLADSSWVEPLLAANTAIKAVVVRNLRTNWYPAPGDNGASLARDVERQAQLLRAIAETGRVALLDLPGLDGPRLLANSAHKPLRDAIRAAAPNLVALAPTRGTHVLQALSASEGLWLDNACAHWAIAPDPGWYADTEQRAPGEWGLGNGADAMPPAWYRTTVLFAAAHGASVYVFPHGPHLWFGEEASVWEDTIAPLFHRLVREGFVARRETVAANAPLAYRFLPADSPPDFLATASDIDWQIGSGRILAAAYGISRAAPWAEVIPDRNGAVLVPFVAPEGGTSPWRSDLRILDTGALPDSDAVVAAIDAVLPAVEPEMAYIAQTQRGYAVIHSNETGGAAQRFRLEGVPLPVGGLRASRNGTETLLEWNARPGDLSYAIFRRLPPSKAWHMLADSVPEPRYLDATADPSREVAYAIRALTSETEAYEGTVAFGESRLVSTVESRVYEEVVLTPVLTEAVAQPIESQADAEEQALPGVSRADTQPEATTPGPDLGLEARQQDVQADIVERLAYWATVVRQGNTANILDLYSSGYEDAQGWGIESVTRSYRDFVDLVLQPRLRYAVRGWDFAELEAGRVNALLYLRLSGYLPSDPTGRIGQVEMVLPQTPKREVWTTWAIDETGTWRLLRTNPAVPEWDSIRSHLAGPYAEPPRPPASASPIPR